MKLGQLTEYNNSNIFFKHYAENKPRRLVGVLVLWFNCRIYLQHFRNFYKRNIYRIICISICGCKARNFQLLLLFGIMTEPVETLTRLRGIKAVYLQNMKNLEWSIFGPCARTKTKYLNYKD